MSENKISIILLNWNGWQDTIECLESLSQIEYANINVIVVDNGSTDDSVNKIDKWSQGKLQVKSKYIIYNPDMKPFPIKIIRLESNLGYAKANNIGIRYALSLGGIKYIMILNNDTIVKKDFLLPLVNIFGKYKNAGLVGPKILDYESGLQKQGPLFKKIDFLTMMMFYTPLKLIFINTPVVKRFLIKESVPKSVYEIVGCCMLFKRQALEAIGLFDENTFLGWEECIIAEKLIKHGLQTYIVPDSVIYHKIGQDTNRIEPVEKTTIFLKSEKYFQDNYLKMPFYQRTVIKIIRLLAYSIIAIFHSAFRKKYKQLVYAIIE